MTSVYKINFVGDALTITKKDGGILYKQTITLSELGGKYDNQYVATYLSSAPCRLHEGTMIAGALSFKVHTFEGVSYQDILLQEYVVLEMPINMQPSTSRPNLPTVPTLPSL